MKITARPLLLLTSVLVLVALYFHFGSNADSKKDKKDIVTQVAYATAHKSDLDVYVNALGSATPHNTVTVRSRVDGQLLNLHFREGQMVKQGDLLAELDSRTYQAQLKQAEGQKMRDEALLQEAKQTYERYKSLFAKDSIPRQQLDTQASLVKQYEGNVKNDQGAVENASTLIDFTRITSPINGRVGLRQVDLGNIVHTGDANGIVVITEVDPISVLFSVPEDRIPALIERMKNNEPLTAEAWNRESSAKLASGALSAIDNQVDSTTGTLKIRADFSNPDNALFPNQFVNVRLKIGTKKDALIIPSSALQRGSKGVFVYRITEDKGEVIVKVTPITIAVTEGDNVAIASGLNEGDRVVTEGGDSLRDDAKISLAEKKNESHSNEPAAPKDKSKNHTAQ